MQMALPVPQKSRAQMALAGPQMAPAAISADMTYAVSQARDQYTSHQSKQQQQQHHQQHHTQQYAQAAPVPSSQVQRSHHQHSQQHMQQSHSGTPQQALSHPHSRHPPPHHQQQTPQQALSHPGHHPQSMPSVQAVSHPNHHPHSHSHSHSHPQTPQQHHHPRTPQQHHHQQQLHQAPHGQHQLTPQLHHGGGRMPSNKMSTPHHHPYGQVAPRPMGSESAFKTSYGPESFRYGPEVEPSTITPRAAPAKVRGGSRAQAGGIGKGLRHFSKTVLQKVKDKGSTTYIEVAEELMEDLARQYAEEKASGNADVKAREIGIDHKNIRRRVYDALNVLMALDVIKKEKKEIKWVGLPTNSAQEYLHLKEEKAARLERIKKKRAHIHELLIQTVTIKNLTERNRGEEQKHGRVSAENCIKLPFLLLNAPNETQIDAEMGEDGSAFCFQFTQPFKLSDEFVVMRGMDLAFDLEKNQCTPENVEKVKSLVPANVVSHIDDMVKYGFGKGPLRETTNSVASLAIGLGTTAHQSPINHPGNPPVVTPSNRLYTAGSK
eukprot:CFRG0875T1